MGTDDEIKRMARRKYKTDWARNHPHSGAAWRKDNIEKVRAAGRNRRRKNPEKFRKFTADWKKKNPDKVKRNYDKWVKENPERHREIAAKARKASSLRHPGKMGEYIKVWNRTNPERRKEIANKYARQKQSEASGMKLAIGFLLIKDFITRENKDGLA